MCNSRKNPTQIQLSIDRTFVSDSRKVTCLVWSHLGCRLRSVRAPIRAGRDAAGARLRYTLQIRILRPLRVRFIVDELSATEMRSYSKTDLQQTRFYVCNKEIFRKTKFIYLGTLFRLPKYSIHLQNRFLKNDI